jgi:ABC-type transport system involved in multi-copper enzyme maturation permease subunit
MIWLIAKKEFHDNWISHKITIAFALCIVLLIVSLWLALKDYSERLSSYSLSRSEDALFLGRIATYTFVDKEGIATQGGSDIGDMIDNIGVYRRPVELSVLARGLDDRMNRPIRFLDIRKLGPQAEIIVGNKQERNKLLALFPPIDFLFITKVMVSLVTILFAFSAIAGERETGTLKLMLSNSVSRGQLLLGKFLGGYASLAAAFLAAALIAVLLAALSPSVALGSEGLLRIALIILVSLVYIAVFFLIGIAVSALTRRSATAVLLLLAIWIVLALVVPNVGWLVAKQVVVVPSEQQIDTEKFKTARQIEDETEKIHPSSSYMPGYGKYHIEAQSGINQALKAIEERHEALRQKRLGLSRLLTRFSPVSSYVYSIVGLAQTGIEDEVRYHSSMKQNQVRVADELERAFNAAFSGEFRRSPPPREDPHAYHAWRVKGDEAMYESFREMYVPVLSFTFEKSSLSDTLSAIRLDLLLLLAWIGLTFVSATLAVIKCEVR